MKNLVYTLLIGIFTLISVNNAQASHYAGAELTYVNIGGISYQITLTFYRDCSGVSAPATAPIDFSCSSNSITNFSVSLNKLGVGVDITPACSTYPTSCSTGSSSAYGVEKVTYQGIVSLPPCNSWTMYWKSGARNPITTLLNTANWYIPAEVNNLVSGNSCPTYNSQMTTIANLNQLNVIDCGAVDPDGDSLVYSFYYLFAEGPIPTQNVNYNIPYDSSNFMPSSTPITLDAVTGILTFTPTQVLNTAYGVKIEEWRNVSGVMTKVGVSYRDLTVKVISSTFSAPILSGVDTTTTHIYSANDTIYTINKCFDGNPIVFSINGLDSDVYNPATTGSEELFNISWNYGISGATLTPHLNGTDAAYAQFSWLPISGNFSNNNSFVATIKDLACPYNLSNSYTYNVNIIDNAISIGSDTTLCYGESLFIQSESNVTFDYYIWTVDGVPANSIPTNDFVNLQPSHLSPGVHVLKLETIGGNSGAGCNNTHEITINVLDILLTGTITDTAYCSDFPYTFDAGTATTYAWQDFPGNIVSNTQYFTPTATGVYRLITQNQSCFGFDTFMVQIFNSPPAFDLGNDTAIADNSSITLSMPLGYSNYTWSNGSTGHTLIVDNSFAWQNEIIGTITEGGICISSDTIYISIGSIGIKENTNSKVRVYPNPIDNVINISFENEVKNAKLKLYDANGKLVRSVEFSSKEYALKGLSDLSSGSYFMKITIDGDEIEYTIIKK